MKASNLLCKSFFVLLIFISFTSCKPKISSVGDDDFCVTYDGRPEQSITYKEMAVMLAEYKATREPILKNGLGFEDTHTNWYQIDSLKKYLAYVEKLSQDSGVEITGINIMSAAYPNKSSFGDEKNYQTLIFNPTTNKGNNPRVSFDPLYSKDGVPAYLDDLLLPYLSEIKNLTYGEKDLKKYIINMTEGLEDQPSSASNRLDTSPPN